MDWIDALILGIVQGLAEYLPISSSGHLAIFRTMLGVELPADQTMMFDVMVHAATVLSTIVVLHKVFFRLCRSFFTFRRDNDFMTVCKILVSCLPIAIVGFFFKDTVESFFGDRMGVVGVCLIVTSLLLAFAFYSGFEKTITTGRDGVPVKGVRLIPADKGRNISWFDALVIGIAQAFAVLPGLSRSGTTIAAGILLGDKRGQVAQFSFLMVIIPILGEALLDLKDFLSEPAATQAATGAIDALPLAIGFISSFIVGCCACKWMISLVKRGKLLWFAIYCLLVGVLCLLWQ